MAVPLAAVALALLLAAIFSLAIGSRAKLPRGARGSVSVAHFVDAAAVLRRAMPCLVRGFPVTPPLDAWASELDVSSVAVLVSPHGVFGAYGSCDPVAPPPPGSALSFAPGRCFDADAKCRPHHYRLEGRGLEEARRIFAEHSYVYIRGRVPATHCLYRSCPFAVSGITAFLSSVGCVTNLHWDGASGFLTQSIGRKRVLLWAPGRMPSPARSTGPCNRRSYVDGPVPPPGADLSLILEQGDALFIPRGWAHHVTSESAETLGAVWRCPATQPASGA